MSKFEDSKNRMLAIAGAALALHSFGATDVLASAINGDLQHPELARGVNNPNWKPPIERDLDTLAGLSTSFFSGCGKVLDGLADDPSLGGLDPNGGEITTASNVSSNGID